MCEKGNMVTLNVPIPAELSYTGEFRWNYKPIDSCISDIVNALNNGDVHTAASCCGHGKRAGEIILHDGRRLLIIKQDIRRKRNTIKKRVCRFFGAEICLLRWHAVTRRMSQ